jgi:hypothetical protein
VGIARPEVIVHQLTASGSPDLRHFDRDFALTNRLRTEGTDHLLSAGHAVGTRRFVAQSNGAFPYARTGGPVKSEDDPLDSAPAREMRESLAAIRHLETAVLGADWTEGIVLRYGAFYGPGTSMWRGGDNSNWSAGASSRWLEMAAVSFLSSTSPTPRTRRSRRSSTAAAVSTTLSTMTPPRSPSGCRRSLTSSAPRSPSRAAVHRAAVRR